MIVCYHGRWTYCLWNCLLYLVHVLQDTTSEVVTVGLHESVVSVYVWFLPDVVHNCQLSRQVADCVVLFKQLLLSGWQFDDRCEVSIILKGVRGLVTLIEYLQHQFSPLTFLPVIQSINSKIENPNQTLIIWIPKRWQISMITINIIFKIFPLILWHLKSPIHEHQIYLQTIYSLDLDL